MIANKFLIVVDMQNDFIDGSLGTKEAQGIVPKVIERIRQAHEDGYMIGYTQDTHHEDYLDTPEGKKLPVPHCIKDTKGWEIPKEILDASGSRHPVLYEKETFGSEEMVGDISWLLSIHDVDDKDVTIEVLGLCTDICVVSNVLLLKANFPDATICVNVPCCAGVTPELHEAALKVMRSCQIDLIGE